MSGAAMPLQEGKTASGEMEKIRLYHAISLVPEGFRNHNRVGTRPVISRFRTTTSKMRPDQSWTCSSIVIPKSPVGRAVKSGQGEPQNPVATGEGGREHLRGRLPGRHRHRQLAAVETIALRESDHRAGTALPRSRIAEFGR